MFTSNINSLDRILRIVIGLFLLSLVFWGPQTAFGYIGLILIVTGFINFCPIYRVFNISTCAKK